MKVVLRDDDTCFYTDYRELEQAFGDLPNVPISLSVIPFAAYEHRGTFPFSAPRAEEPYPEIGKNAPLVSYLKEKIASGQYSILLHGIHHEYQLTAKECWKTEIQLLSKQELLDGIANGKQYLERLFGITIQTFIGPSNDLSASCAAVLDKLGLNTNYIISKHFNRQFSFRNAANYLYGNLYRIVTGQRFSGVLQYSNHFEITSYPFTDLQSMQDRYLHCKKQNQPLVIYTHYWSLNTNSQEKRELRAFIDWAIQDGAQFLPMDQLWK